MTQPRIQLLGVDEAPAARFLRQVTPITQRSAWYSPIQGSGVGCCCFTVGSSAPSWRIV